MKLGQYHRLFILLFIGIFSAAAFTATAFCQENPCAFSGYLWGTGARTSFEVFAEEEVTDVLITWPEGTAGFHVRATDSDNKRVLIDQPLSEGDRLTLTGRGIYHFEIYSEWGSGCWKATVKKLDNLKKR
jgi:hypothetical protein